MTQPTLNPEALEKAFAAADEASPTGRAYSPGITAAIRTYLASLPPVDAEPVASNLVERLRKASASTDGRPNPVRADDALMREAAAAIIALQGERDRWRSIADERRKVSAEFRSERDDALDRAVAGEAEVARLKDELAQKEEERAEQWRQRREAQGSRDATKAACDSLRLELAEAHRVIETWKRRAARHFAKSCELADRALSAEGELNVQNSRRPIKVEDGYLYQWTDADGEQKEYLSPTPLNPGDAENARSFRDGQKTGEKG